MLGIESVERMIRKGRLQWVAHSARRGQSDFTLKIMRLDIEDEKTDGKSIYVVIGMNWESKRSITGRIWRKTGDI